MSTSDSDERLNLLVAFPYINPGTLRTIAQGGDRIRLLVDSGAFTAWKSGTAISLDDYCAALGNLPVKPWRYFVLDVIGDPVATLRNYRNMRERGLSPVPIFTRGEDPKHLAAYYKTSDVVGIGGLVGTRGNRGFVNGIMKKVGARKVHWLGFTSLPFLRKYRPYMCDSAAWESGAQFAAMSLYAGGTKKVVSTKKDFVKRPREELVRLIASYGVDARELATNKSWSGKYSVSRSLNAHSAVRLSLEVQRRLGTLMFAAATTTHAIELLLRGFDKERRFA